MPSNKQTRLQKHTLDLKYTAFLAKDGKPEDSNANPLNIFDRSNIIDKKWLLIARASLRKLSSE